MKKRYVAAFVLSVLTSSSPATAQVYGQFTGAETVPLGGRLFGAYAFTSENVLALLAQLRLSFYPNVDFGFNGGIARQDFGGGHRTTLRLGTGLKVKLADSTAQVPMALAFAADLGIETGDDFHVLTVVPSVIGSRTFKFGQNSTVTPYGRAGIAISQIDVANNEDTDVAIPLRLGADFGVAPGLRLAAELQINLSDAFNDNIGFGAGVNLPF